MTVTWAQALSWRLRRHLLDPRSHESVSGVVGRLGAVLAMDDRLADLAVGARRHGHRSGDVAAALAEGALVKAFAFRGATHYLTPEDGGAYLALRAAGRQWELPSWQDYYELSPADWPRLREAVRDALADGPLTLPELGAAVTRRRAFAHLRPVFDEGAGTLIKPLTWQGDMGFAAPRDGQATFQRLEVAPGWAGVWDLDDAGRHAITAYVGSYGPSTAEQVHSWLGNGLSAGTRRLRGWLADLADRLVTVEVQGEPRLMLDEHVDDLHDARVHDSAHLLPGHDQWVIGPSTKDEHVVPADRRTPVTRKANLVVVGGVVRGTWLITGDAVSVTWLDAEVRPPRAELESAAGRVGEIVGRPLGLVIG